MLFIFVLFHVETLTMLISDNLTSNEDIKLLNTYVLFIKTAVWPHENTTVFDGTNMYNDKLESLQTILMAAIIIPYYSSIINNTHYQTHQR
jgi:hypothetical protein